MPSFGEAIKRLRKEKRLSQDELGAKAGLNGQTISNVETGKVQVPRGDTYRRIAESLGMTVSELDASWSTDTVPVDLPRAAFEYVVARAGQSRLSPAEWIMKEIGVNKQGERTKPYPSNPRNRTRKPPDDSPAEQPERNGGGQASGRSK